MEVYCINVRRCYTLCVICNSAFSPKFENVKKKPPDFQVPTGTEASRLYLAFFLCVEVSKSCLRTSLGHENLKVVLEYY